MHHKVLGIFLALYSFAVFSANSQTLQDFLLTELDPKIGQALMAKNKTEIEKALGKTTPRKVLKSLTPQKFIPPKMVFHMNISKKSPVFV